MKNVRRIGFVVKHHQPEAARLAVDVSRYLLSEGFQIAFCTESKEIVVELKRLKLETKSPKDVLVVPKEKLPSVTDLILVLGGDGTYLSIARLMREKSVPVLGVNMGQLGFLTEVKQEEVFDVLHRVLFTQDVKLSERRMLDVSLVRKRKVVFNGPVVNDAVISKGAIARIIGMQLAVNGTWVAHYRADGLIVATPTGTTAYSLSAGGPIVEPTLGAMVIAPICPHALTQRPLVLPDHYNVEIKLDQRPGHVSLTLDGQDVVEVQEDDIIRVRVFKKHVLKLVQSPSRDYYSLLREKLNFGSRG